MNGILLKDLLRFSDDELANVKIKFNQHNGYDDPRGRMASDLVTILGEVYAQEWESIDDEMDSGTNIMAVSDDVIAAAMEPDAEWTPEEIRKWYGYNKNRMER